MIASTCARLWSFRSTRTNRTRKPAITSACGDISSFISAHGIRVVGPRGTGAAAPALAAAISARSRRAAASSGLRARHAACVFTRRLAWHASSPHARWRAPTRGSARKRQRQYGQRVRGRIRPLWSGEAAAGRPRRHARGERRGRRQVGPFAAAEWALPGRRWHPGATNLRRARAESRKECAESSLSR